jgi:uncharacterized cupredoxin-like copper-binding protein
MLAAAMLTGAAPAIAAEVIKVQLADSGAMEMPTGLGMGSAGADMSKATFKIILEPATVKAGEVTFEAINTSKELVHEMLVAPLPADGTLPYDTGDGTVSEDAAASLGEVEELDPAASGELTLDLAPGKYAVFCNVPGHYDAGMWTVLDVHS